MSIIRLILTILNKAEKRKLLLYLFFSLMLMVVENLGLASFFPFIGILLTVDSEEAPSNEYLRGLYQYLEGVSHMHILIIGSIMIVLLFIIKTIANRQYIIFSTKLTESIKARISSNLISRYLKSPYTFHIERSTPNIIRSITSDMQNFQSATKSYLNIFKEGILIFGICVLLLNLDFLMFSIIFVLLGLGVLGVIIYSKRNMGYLGAEIRKLERDITKNALTSLGGIKEAKVLNREDSFIQEHFVTARKLGKVRVYASIKPSLTKHLLELVVVALTVSIVIFMIFIGRDSKDILSKISLFGIASLRLLPSMNALSTSWSSMKVYRNSVKAIHKDLLTVKETPRDKEPLEKISFENGIRIVNASYQYPNTPENTYAIRNLTISIPKNKTIGFVGGSGAGKTTLIDLILGLIYPQKGNIFIDNFPLKLNNIKSWQSIIGYIPQNIFLADMSIKENIAFGLKNKAISQDRVIECLKTAQLYDFVRGLPNGLDTYIGESGIRLSGGQRQRIGVARALYKDPDILLMDEATSALDNKTEKHFSEAIHAISGMKTIIIVAHRLSTIKNCDLIYVMKNSQIVSSGTYQQLEKNDPNFQELLA